MTKRTKVDEMVEELRKMSRRNRETMSNIRINMASINDSVLKFEESVSRQTVLANELSGIFAETED